MKKAMLLILCVAVYTSLTSCSQKPVEIKETTIAGVEMVQKPTADLSKLQKATFAAGCFWCEEAVFESIKGVEEVISGYSGGTESNPTYEEVGSGTTGHAEAFEVYYDSTKVDYKSLLRVYFASQDPTQVNGQGPDEGTQYRSIIFYRNTAEKEMAEAYKEELNKSGKFKAPIAAEIVPFVKFWPAEDYHQDYVQHHPENPYVQHESIPRLIRTQLQVKDLVKPEKSMLKN